MKQKPPPFDVDLETTLEQVLDVLADRVAARIGEHLAGGVHDKGASQCAGLVDVRGAASLLSLSASTIYKLSAAGRIPGVHLGSRLLFRVKDLEDYVNRNWHRARHPNTRAEDEGRCGHV